MPDIPTLSSARRLILRERLKKSLRRALEFLETTQETDYMLGNELVIAVRTGIDLYGPSFFFLPFGEWVARTDRIKEGQCVSCDGLHINQATGDDHMCDTCRTEIDSFIAELENASLPD